MKKKISLEVIGNEDALMKFVQLMMFINECARSGHHGSLTLDVDGDGSASVAVFFKGDQDAIVSDNFEVMKALDDGRLWIGE